MVSIAEGSAGSTVSVDGAVVTTPSPAVEPQRSGVTIGAVRFADGGEVARLIDGILPEGTDAELADDGLRLVGDEATAWRNVATELLVVIALVLGDGAAQAAVDGLLRESRAPKFREWCFVNTKLQNERVCHAKRAACEADARDWLGPEARCDGKK